MNFGSWQGIPGQANLIDHERPYNLAVPRFVRGFRLKEWRSFIAGNADVMLLAVLYDAKFMSMLWVEIVDRKERRSYGWRHIEPGRRFRIPDSLYPENKDASIRFKTMHGRCFHAMDAGKGSAFFEAEHVSSRHGMLSCSLEFDLRSDSCSPISINHPFGRNRSLYSTKIFLPVKGELLLGSKVITLEGASSSAILEDTKGYYPYPLRYDALSGFGFGRAGERVGFNFAVNQVSHPERFNENRLWLGTEVHDMPQVKITKPYGRKAPWVIQDMEGMVDLVFTPQNKNDFSVHAGLFDIDYCGPFGKLEGTLKYPDGRTINASSLYALGEEKNVRL